MAKLTYISIDQNSQAVFNISTHKIVAKNVPTCDANEICQHPENTSNLARVWEEKNCLGDEAALFIGVIIGIGIAGIFVIGYHAAHHINKWCEHYDASMEEGRGELVAHGEIQID